MLFSEVDNSDNDLDAEERANLKTAREPHDVEYREDMTLTTADSGTTEDHVTIENTLNTEEARIVPLFRSTSNTGALSANERSFVSSLSHLKLNVVRIHDKTVSAIKAPKKKTKQDESVFLLIIVYP